MKLHLLLPLITTASLVIASVNPVYAVNAKTEVQLQKMSPMVKTISIALKGSEYEQETLQTIANMVNQMLDNTKIGTVNVPVNHNPTASTEIPTLQRLSMVIQADAPDAENAPHAVTVTIQDETQTDGGQVQSFAYYPEQHTFFYQQLQRFLTQTLDLKPISN